MFIFHSGEKHLEEMASISPLHQKKYIKFRFFRKYLE